ncbi:DnaD domain protein [Salinibacillus aidingensis]|uniref:DnaD domain protein n=1 Tax=Salinibacillus aidingensis TaxID=237684 RepID=A0ABN1AY79_9BACI
MNYIQEINAFYTLGVTNPVSNSAVSLWHALMHINNLTRWRKTFTVAATVLKTKSGLKDSAFKRARKELVDKGYIHVRSRGGNQAPEYQMVSLLAIMDHSANPKADHTMDQSTDQSLNHSADPLIKERKTKENQTNPTTTNAKTASVIFFEENAGELPTYIQHDVQEWAQSVGDELVIQAIKRALERNKANWGYVKSILKSWEKKGITSVEEAEGEEQTYQKQRSKPRVSRKREVLPEWFEVEKEKEKQPLAKKSRKEIEDEKQELAGLLAKL